MTLVPRVLYEWTQISKSDVNHISPHLALSRLSQNTLTREITLSVRAYPKYYNLTNQTNPGWPIRTWLIGETPVGPSGPTQITTSRTNRTMPGWHVRTNSLQVRPRDLAILLPLHFNNSVVNPNDCLYVPGMSINVFSLQKLRRLEGSYSLSGKPGQVVPLLNSEGVQFAAMHETDWGRPVLILREAEEEAEEIEGGEELAVELLNEEVAQKPKRADVSVDINRLHLRLGHLSLSAMQRMAREGLVDGIDGPLVGKLDSCDGCAKGKAQEPPHPSQNPKEKSTEPYGREC